MNQYNTSNIKLHNLQLNKLKSGMKNGTEVMVLNLILRLIFLIIYYNLNIIKFERFVTLLQMIHQLI